MYYKSWFTYISLFKRFISFLMVCTCMCLYMGMCSLILFSYYNVKLIEGIKPFNCHCEFVIPSYKQINSQEYYTHLTKVINVNSERQNIWTHLLPLKSMHTNTCVFSISVREECLKLKWQNIETCTEYYIWLE